MALNPYQVLRGYDFFREIKGKLKAEKGMLFKFGGPLPTFYFNFILNFNSLTPENTRFMISTMKIMLYPLVFLKQRHVKKKELIKFLRENYPFFDKLCKKYKIGDDLVYNEKLSSKEIENLYNFLAELVVNVYEKF